MAHAQKTDFVFRRNGRVHLNRQGRQFSRLLAAEVCASAVVMLDTMFRGSVKGTGYPLHSPVSPSLPLPCVTVCHHISTGLCYEHSEIWDRLCVYRKIAVWRDWDTYIHMRTLTATLCDADNWEGVLTEGLNWFQILRVCTADVWNKRWIVVNLSVCIMALQATPR